MNFADNSGGDAAKDAGVQLIAGGGWTVRGGVAVGGVGATEATAVAVARSAWVGMAARTGTGPTVLQAPSSV